MTESIHSSLFKLALVASGAIAVLGCGDVIDFLGSGFPDCSVKHKQRPACVGKTTNDCLCKCDSAAIADPASPCHPSNQAPPTSSICAAEAQFPPVISVLPHLSCEPFLPAVKQALTVSWGYTNEMKVAAKTPSQLLIADPRLLMHEQSQPNQPFPLNEPVPWKALASCETQKMSKSLPTGVTPVNGTLGNFILELAGVPIPAFAPNIIVGR